MPQGGRFGHLFGWAGNQPLRRVVAFAARAAMARDGTSGHTPDTTKETAMRTILLASAALLCLTGGAFAQNSTGSPMSGKASNITGSNTRSTIAPRLPMPGADEPNQLLMQAQSALARGRTGAAQEALERAETRLLDRATPASDASTPISGPRIDAIRKALSSLGTGDRAGAKSAISMAMSQPAGGMGNGGMGNGAMGNGSMGGGAMGGSMAPGMMQPAAGAGVTTPGTMSPGGMAPGSNITPSNGAVPSGGMAPAGDMAPGSMTPPVNPAGATGGTGNQGGT